MQCVHVVVVLLHMTVHPTDELHYNMTLIMQCVHVVVVLLLCHVFRGDKQGVKMRLGDRHHNRHLSTEPKAH
jgi:hypothetical protein